MYLVILVPLIHLLQLSSALPYDSDIPPESLEVYRQAALQAHNDKRRNHGSPPMQLSPVLNDYAQELANSFKKTHSVARSGGPYGENFFCTKDPSMQGDDPVISWYSQVKNYNWANPKIQPNTEEFTQVVWKRSTELGIGVSRCSFGTHFLVAVYNAKGNIEEEVTDNVPHLIYGGPQAY